MAHLHSLASDHLLSDPVLSCCNAAELLHLSCTSKIMRSIVQDFMRRSYNLNRSLQYFFDNPFGFRIMQSYTNAIISGAFALQFFTRTHHPSTHLDIYVGDAWKKLVGGWLLENGYSYVPAVQTVNNTDISQPAIYEEAIVSLGWIPDNFHYEGVLGVLNFSRMVNGTERIVHLVVASVCSIQTVLKFNSSMWFILFILDLIIICF